MVLLPFRREDLSARLNQPIARENDGTYLYCSTTKAPSEVIATITANYPEGKLVLYRTGR